MPFVIRNADGDYWSNQDGWTEFRTFATFFDNAETVNDPVESHHREEVPNRIAGMCALRRLSVDRDGDEWGWAMSWMFALCDTMLFDRGMEIPFEWEFRPSPIGKCTDDEWKDEILSDLSDNQLAYLGNLLHRYTTRLRKAGKDY